MKGKINANGQLYIERAGRMKAQGCSRDQEDVVCGDWCPLFGEPYASRWIGSPDPDKKDRETNIKHWDLQLCQTMIHFDELIDERKKGGIMSLEQEQKLQK